MLINCPKCGFSQPQDKYCAQCGIDMEAFQPAPESMGKKFFSNPAFHVVSLLLVSGFVLSYLYQKDRSQLKTRIDYLQGNTQISSSATPGESSQTQQDDQILESTDNNVGPAPASEGSPEAAESSAQLMNFTQNAEPDSTNTSATSTDSSEKSKAVNSKERSLTITYAEISRSGLAKLIYEAQSQGEFADFRDYATGAVSNFEEKKETFSFEVLHRETLSLKTNSANWFHGLKDMTESGPRVGFNGYVSSQRLPQDRLRVNIEILRSWREGLNGDFHITQREYPLQAEVTPDTTLFMTGLMPKRSNLEDQSQLLTSLPMFKILNSVEFQNQQSDFVIFLEIK